MVLVEARWGCEATVLSTVSLVSGLFGQSARLMDQILSSLYHGLRQPVLKPQRPRHDRTRL
jgi:hypothetical protein